MEADMDAMADMMRGLLDIWVHCCHILFLGELADEEEEGSDGGDDDGDSDVGGEGDNGPFDISDYDDSASTGALPETMSVDSYAMFYSNSYSYNVVTPIHSYNKHWNM